MPYTRMDVVWCSGQQEMDLHHENLKHRLRMRLGVYLVEISPHRNMICCQMDMMCPVSVPLLWCPLSHPESHHHRIRLILDMLCLSQTFQVLVSLSHIESTARNNGY